MARTFSHIDIVHDEVHRGTDVQIRVDIVEVGNEIGLRWECETLVFERDE